MDSVNGLPTKQPCGLSRGGARLCRHRCLQPSDSAHGRRIKRATTAQKLLRYALAPPIHAGRRACPPWWTDSQLFAGSGQGRMTSSFEAIVGARDGASHSRRQGLPASLREHPGSRAHGVIVSVTEGSKAVSQSSLRAHLRPGKSSSVHSEVATSFSASNAVPFCSMKYTARASFAARMALPLNLPRLATRRSA